MPDTPLTVPYQWRKHFRQAAKNLTAHRDNRDALGKGILDFAAKHNVGDFTPAMVQANNRFSSYNQAVAIAQKVLDDAIVIAAAFAEKRETNSKSKPAENLPIALRPVETFFQSTRRFEASTGLTFDKLSMDRKASILIQAMNQFAQRVIGRHLPNYIAGVNDDPARPVDMTSINVTFDPHLIGFVYATGLVQQELYRLVLIRQNVPETEMPAKLAEFAETAVHVYRGSSNENDLKKMPGYSAPPGTSLN